MELLLDDLSAGCSIPGMGLECVPHMEDKEKTQSLATPIGSAAIPGLDFSMSGDALDDDMRRVRTISHSYNAQPPNLSQLTLCLCL